MGLAELRGHGGFVIEVSKAAIRVQGAGVQNGLGGLFDLRPLALCGLRPGKVVVDNINPELFTPVSVRRLTLGKH